jgi:hypothetical protein
VVDPKSHTTRREKIDFWLRELYFLFTVVTVAVFYAFIAVFIYQHFNDLSESDSAWSNFFVITIVVFRTIHIKIKSRNIHKIMKKLKLLFDASVLKHSERYQKSLSFSNIMQKVYRESLYGKSKNQNFLYFINEKNLSQKVPTSCFFSCLSSKMSSPC